MPCFSLTGAASLDAMKAVKRDSSSRLLLDVQAAIEKTVVTPTGSEIGRASCRERVLMPV